MAVKAKAKTKAKAKAPSGGAKGSKKTKAARPQGQSSRPQKRKRAQQRRAERAKTPKPTPKLPRGSHAVLRGFVAPEVLRACCSAFMRFHGRHGSDSNHYYGAMEWKVSTNYMSVGGAVDQVAACMS